jgi:putative ABC transport system permease protein
MEPGLNYLHIDVLSATLDPHMRPWRLGSTMFLAFGGLALVIAAIGLYSVIAYSVAQRRAELGVRLAMGARSLDIVGMIVRQGVGLVLLGIAVGGLLAVLGGRYIEPLLFETDAMHAGSFAFVAAVLLVVALLATMLPAARAGRTDPLEALRAE